MIGKLTDWVLRRSFREGFSSENPDHRSRIGMIEGWSSVAVNLVLFAVKLGIGILTASIALIADAFHTLADMSTSLIIIFSFRISKKPSDRQHPFGHQRAEAIATIIIATLLFVTGLELGKSSVQRILHPEPFMSRWWIIGVIFLTVIIKEGLARFAVELSKRIGSETLKADAWHHRSDALATLLVMVAFILGQYNIHALDGYVGLAVAALIMYTGYDVAKESVDHLLGSAPEPEFIERIHEIAERHPEIGNVHDIMLHQYGNRRFVSLDIELNQDLSLQDAHQIADRIAKDIKKDLRTHATVHIDPVRVLNGEEEKIGKVIQEAIRRHPQIRSYHDLSISTHGGKKHIRFDLVVDQNATEKEMEEIRRWMASKVQKASQNVHSITIQIESSYSLNQ